MNQIAEWRINTAAFNSSTQIVPPPIVKKEYVLVSQGMEIFRTTNKTEAEQIMNESNDEWSEYVQKCRDIGEAYVDNEIFMYEE